MTDPSRGELVQIGQVAERTGLSLRTIRFYEENGLVIPTARSEGGFRLYSEDDVARLEVVKRMKPLGFSLEEMQELLTLLADLDSGDGDRAQLLDRLRMFHAAATARVTALREQLGVAEGFADTLAGHLGDRH
ncbi:MerR family transcriptional regulator [Blastococcus saxobsidens]|uniref:Predicted transcriptional regulator (MerR family) of metal efflux transporter expression n=1 Tax=Blastococcus saxobsidens (strain DD2) TaxID=1146883 RepID=H6RW36_BLASD|nr:MerR family transcriptional regulator [Blastococcus saxobsidens]CCG02053.1 Predicted transcriptional regulator (MerR family) of metal efflux transporter expression [Blastococcus saxobsidens DD2]